MVHLLTSRRAISIVARASLMFVLVATTIVSPGFSAVHSNLANRQKRDLLPIVGIEDLSFDNKELAEQLEIWTMLTELYDKTKRPTRERATVLRQKIRETIFESYLDAESVEAEAHRETGYLEAQRESLVSKRDRDIELNNATNFIASGTLNTVGSVLGFSPNFAPFPGNLNQMLSGVVATAMSTYSLKQSKGGKTRGQGQPTIIAELFGRPCDDRTSYPESVWRFLHGKSPDHPENSRAEMLEQRWIMRKHLEKHGSHRESLKLDLISGMAKDKKCMTLDDLNDQITMIADIDAVVSLLSHHLRDLLRMIDSDVIETRLPQQDPVSTNTP